MLSENKLLKALSSPNMSELVPLINEVIDTGRPEEIQLLSNVRLTFKCHFKTTSGTTDHDISNAPLIILVININDHSTLEKMINAGFDYNDPIRSWNGDEVWLTPLMFASMFNCVDIVKILLKYNADFLGYADTKFNIFEIASISSKREIIELLLKQAKDKDTVWELLSRTCSRPQGIFQEYVPEEVICALLMIVLSKHFNSYLTLRDLRIFSPLIHTSFDTRYKVLNIDTNKKTFTPQQAFFSSTKHLKKDQIQLALATYKNLLCDPISCFDLLKDLEIAITKEVQKSFSITNLKDISSTEYTIEKHYVMEWPIPTEAYKPLKLNSLLSRTIIAELRTFECGKSSYKWYGFVAHELANDHIAHGEHTTENTLDINALLHGKYSHSLQLLILMYAIKNKYIDLSYSDNQKLTIHELLKALVTPGVHGKAPWIETNDMIQEHYLSFSGPHSLHSILMLHGDKYGLSNLSHCLTNSFCKSVIRCMNYYNKYHNGAFSSPKDMWDNLVTLLNPTKFLSIDVHSFFKQPKNSIRTEELFRSGTIDSYHEETYLVSVKSSS